MERAKTLKEGLWAAAGWGSPYCKNCGAELKRTHGPDLCSYDYCPNKKCKDVDRTSK